MKASLSQLFFVISGTFFCVLLLELIKMHFEENNLDKVSAGFEKIEETNTKDKNELTVGIIPGDRADYNEDEAPKQVEFSKPEKDIEEEKFLMTNQNEKDFTYMFYSRSSSTLERGFPFQPSPELLTQFGLPFKHFVTASRDAVSQFVFVTGVSADHFGESKDTVGSIQTNCPGHFILYFDWGLKQFQRDEVTTWCDVKVRDFNLTWIPEIKQHHFGMRSKFHASKAAVITLALQDYPAVFWVDASTRFLTNELQYIYQKVVLNKGFLLFGAISFHSTFTVTPPGMYKYFPTDKNIMKVKRHYESGAMFFMRTKEVYDNILKWLFLCSANPQCIFADDVKENCHHKTLIPYIFANCSRSDQSVINILADNMYNFNHSRICYSECRSQILVFQGGLASSDFPLKKCT